MKHAITILAALMLLSFSTAIYLGQLHDVSTIGAEIGDVLSYNGRGWVPKNGLSVDNIGQEEVLFKLGDSLSSKSTFIFDDSAPGGSDQLNLTGGVQPTFSALGSVAGWLEIGTPSNAWQFIALASEIRMKPSTTDGTWEYRNAANSTIMTYNTNTALLSNTGAISTDIGYQVNGTAPLGQYLRGDGGKGVFSTIQKEDLPPDTITMQFPLLKYTGNAADTIASNQTYYFGAVSEAIANRDVVKVEINTSKNVSQDLGFWIYEQDLDAANQSLILPDATPSFFTLSSGTRHASWDTSDAELSSVTRFTLGEMIYLETLLGSVDGAGGLEDYVATEGSNGIYLTLYFIE